MRAHLAAVDRVFLAHDLLDERVARLALHRPAAERFDGLDRVPHEARVVDDRLARVLAEHALRQQPDDVVALDEAAVLVEEKTAVEVAVPGDAEVGPGRADGVDRGRPVLDEHRVRHAVREVAVRLVVHLDELERQVRLDQVQRRARGAVARVDHDLEVGQRRQVDEAQQLADIVVSHVDLAVFARRVGNLPFVALGNPANVLEARVAADGPGLLAHHLEAVVVGRVVAGRNHDAAVGAELAGAVIDHLGAADADVQHVAARLGETPGHRRRQLVARVADIAAQHDALRAQVLGRRVADAVGDVRVELVRDAPTHVVGLETVDRNAHRYPQVLVPSRPY